MQANFQWPHSSQQEDYFPGLSEERARVLIYSGWMAGTTFPWKEYLSFRLPGPREETLAGHVPYREGQMFLTDIFQEQESSVLL